MTVPSEFLQSGTEYKLEIQAIEARGNQTLTEITFSTTYGSRRLLEIGPARLDVFGKTAQLGQRDEAESARLELGINHASAATVWLRSPRDRET